MWYANLKVQSIMTNFTILTYLFHPLHCLFFTGLILYNIIGFEVANVVCQPKSAKYNHARIPPPPPPPPPKKV